MTTDIDKICGFSIGPPDTITGDLSTIGGCLQSTLNSSPASARTFAWSEVDEITSFSYTFTRTSGASTLSVSLALIEKSIKKWERKDTDTLIIWRNPLTGTNYTTNLPAGVMETSCREDDRVVFYTEELCYAISPPVSFSVPGSPGIPQDAYNGTTPRTDGVPPLFFVGVGSNALEFDNTGTRLYGIKGITFHTTTYNSSFAVLGSTSVALNFLGFPAAAGYGAVGLTVHPDTGIVYVLYMDPGPKRLYLARIINNVVNLVGDTQYNASVAPIFDGHDIVFTKSGQLLYAHGQNLYLIDSSTGIISITTPIAVKPVTTNAFGIRQVTRYYNGDLHMAATDASFGSYVTILDGETYEKKQDWYSGNSTTPPISNYTIAYPGNPNIKFKRLYVKNIETNQESTEDRDIITGGILTLPNNVNITKCSTDVPKEVSWTEDVCYIIDKNILSQGTIEIASTGQIVSNAACTPVGGFVSPAPLTYSSITHNNAGLQLYALNAGGNLLDTYNWATISAPALLTSVGITGYVSGGENEKSLRTRWTDDTLWLMTEEVVGVNRIYRFYIVNKTTAVLTLQGSVSYPAGSNANGHFTWGVDDNLYFSYNIGGGIYRVSLLSKVSYNILDSIFDVSGTIDNINTDLPSQRLSIVKSGVAGIDYYSYSGQLLSSCAGAIYQDALQAPFGIFAVGDTVTRVKKIFIKDLITGDVSSYYHNYVTGEDIVLPPLARIVKCDTNISVPEKRNPRFRVFTGITSWQKSISAPKAKSVTITRLANNITINDGVNGAQNINTAATFTWADENLGNDLIVSGTAGGSSFAISYLE